MTRQRKLYHCRNAHDASWVLVCFGNGHRAVGDLLGSALYLSLCVTAPTDACLAGHVRRQSSYCDLSMPI